MLINVKVSDKQEAMNDEEVKTEADAVAKALEGNGRLLLRPSGTENLVRVMVEAETQEICQEMAERVAKKLEKYKA